MTIALKDPGCLLPVITMPFGAVDGGNERAHVANCGTHTYRCIDDGAGRPCVPPEGGVFF